MDPEGLLAEARVELARKSLSQIEEETAWRWAARAVAAYENVKRAHADRDQNLTGGWLMNATTFEDEAVEHAALADRSGDVLRRVRAWIDAHVPRVSI